MRGPYKALLFCWACTAIAGSGETVFSPPSIGLLQEFGMLKSGRWGRAGNFQNEYVDHFGAFFTQEAVIREKLTITVGLGGIFQYQKPEEVLASWGGSQYKNFFVGPTQATLAYKIGTTQNPFARITVGMFPFKYNPEAANLGEYLFRTNPYPNYLLSGGYAVVQNATAYLQGAHLEFNRKRFDLHLLLITETTYPPLYDGSVAALARYRFGEGWLEISGGVNFKRLLSVRPSRTSPTASRNAYFEKNGTWYVGNRELYLGRRDFAALQYATPLNAALDSLRAMDPGGAESFLSNFQMGYKGADLDSALNRLRAANDTRVLNVLDTSRNLALFNQSIAQQQIIDSVLFWTTTDSILDPVSGNQIPYTRPAMEHFSARGILLMGRLSLDPKKLLHLPFLGAQDLKIFAEVALLGWKNYPVLYEKRSDRIPVMAGINLPAFKVLDLLALQAEYYRSPYLNSTAQVAAGLPQPYFPKAGETAYSRNAYFDRALHDNVYWSLLAEKTVFHGVTLRAQAARDHLRAVSLNSWFGPGLETDENLVAQKDWYWMVQIAMGI